MMENIFALDSVPTAARLNKVTAQLAAYQGRTALRVELAPTTVAAQDFVDSNTFVVIPSDFGDGEIEVDLLGRLQAAAPSYARGFIGVAFRIAPECSTFEAVYLRPTNGRADDSVRRQRAIQYFAYPDWKFERLRQETPGLYEAGADIGPDEWLRLRLVVAGAQAQVYLDGLGNGAPLLVVNDLKLGPTARGAVGLWVDIGTEGYFANLRIVHGRPSISATGT
ncbi:MAG TPA: hypothetical protein VHO69_14955 [Phototrophicaceae bacterium]|nr:hypothetical protein [Phototrophicaceae bacterium]